MSHTIVGRKIEETQDRLEKLGFAKIPITFDIRRLKPGYAGVSYPHARYIEISEDYLREHHEKIISISVPHEVCHIYVREYFPRARQAHGPEFRRLMNLLGLDGKTYHDMKLENGPARATKTKVRYVYVTTRTMKTVYLTKGQHMKQVSCACLTCRGENIVYTGSIVTYK